MKKMIKVEELKNVSGGMEIQEFTGETNYCPKCKSFNIEHRTRNNGCKEEGYIVCLDCGNEF